MELTDIAANVDDRLSVIDDQLKDLRASRTQINEQIKALSDERAALDRVARATKPRTRKARAQANGD